MGKIVRGAKLAERAYVVSVPEIERSVPTRAHGELDERFAPRDAEFDELDGLGAGDDSECALQQPQVDWEAVKADARALIERASSDGEALLRDAGTRARALLDDALKHVAEIQAKARESGREEGLEQGRAAGHAEMAEAVTAIHDVVRELRDQRGKAIESAEPEVVRLATAIAERIVHEHVAVAPGVVVETVRHALVRLVGREVVTLRVNPADLETIRQHRDAIVAANDVEHLRILEDQRVDRGGVVIETDAGTIDAKIATQLREARRTVQNADAISVSQAS